MRPHVKKKFVVTVDDIVSFFFITEHYLMHLDIYIFIDVVHRHSKIADTQYLGFFHYLCFLWCEMPSHFWIIACVAVELYSFHRPFFPRHMSSARLWGPADDILRTEGCLPNNLPVANETITRNCDNFQLCSYRAVWAQWVRGGSFPVAPSENTVVQSHCFKNWNAISLSICAPLPAQASKIWKTPI